MKNVCELPGRPTMRFTLCQALPSCLQTLSPSDVPVAALHDTQSPRPRFPCFSTYLLLFFCDMFQAGNHEFRGQGTESEPCTPGLQGGDDLWQIVTDEAKSGIFSKFLNHWQGKREPPHVHPDSSRDPETLNFPTVTWSGESRMQTSGKATAAREGEPGDQPLSPQSWCTRHVHGTGQNASFFMTGCDPGTLAVPFH